MLKTVLIIIVSVTIFGVFLFFLVKRGIKKKIDYYIKTKNNKN